MAKSQNQTHQHKKATLFYKEKVTSKGGGKCELKIFIYFFYCFFLGQWHPHTIEYKILILFIITNIWTNKNFPI